MAASAIEADLRYLVVQHEFTDFLRLVEDRIMQRVSADIAPETVETVFVGRRARARQLEDARGDVERDMGGVDLGGIGIRRRLSALARPRIPARGMARLHG